MLEAVAVIGEQVLPQFDPAWRMAETVQPFAQAAPDVASHRDSHLLKRRISRI